MDTKKLRQKILDLAIRGKLVPQDPKDEPASLLLERIRAEKERLIAEGKIKRPKKSKATSRESHYQQFEPPFLIPDSWEWVPVAEIGEIVTGNTPPKDIQEYYGGDISFFKPTDLEQGIETVNSSDHLSDLGYRLSRPLPVNSILITCIGATIGKTGLIRRKGSCNQQINAIIPFEQINPEYIYFACISGYFQSAIRENASSTTLPILNKNNFSSLLLPLPPAKEQDRIIRQIYRLLEELIKIEASEERLGTVIDIAKSKILDLAMHGKLVPQDPTDVPASDMLRRINPKAKIITDNPHYPQLPDNWVLTTIGSVCHYGNSQTIAVSDIEEDDWVLELEDIESYTGKLLHSKKKKERAISGVRHSFKSGNILFSRLRTYLNKVLLSTKDGFCSTEMIPITPFKCVISEYLYFWLKSPFFIEYTISCGYGVKMPRLSTSDANKAIIPLPPLEEQKRIVETIQKFQYDLNGISNSLNLN